MEHVCINITYVIGYYQFIFCVLDFFCNTQFRTLNFTCTVSYYILGSATFGEPANKKKINV